jgi:hypothetical protein
MNNQVLSIDRGSTMQVGSYTISGSVLSITLQTAKFIKSFALG